MGFHKSFLSHLAQHQQVSREACFSFITASRIWLFPESAFIVQLLMGPIPNTKKSFDAELSLVQQTVETQMT